MTSRLFTWLQNHRVERTNKTVKSKIYYHMTQYGTRRWVDILDLIVENMNNSKNTTTKHTPLEIIEKKEIRNEVKENIKTKAESRVPLVEEQEENLDIGDSVRVALVTQKQHRAAEPFAKSIKQNWSKKIYTIRAISEPTEASNRKTYLLKKYFASQLMKVDPSKLIRDDLGPENRPDYDPKMFNQEKHLIKLHKEKKDKEIVLPKTALQERSENPKRERKKPDRFSY